MEPLFTVKHQNNEDEFVRFNRAVAAKFGHKKLALIFVNIMLLCAIFAAISIMMFTDNMPDIMLFIFIALGVYMNYAYTFGMDRRARKLYQQTKAAQGIVNEYDFFDEYFAYRNAKWARVNGLRQAFQGDRNTYTLLSYAVKSSRLHHSKSRSTR